MAGLDPAISSRALKEMRGSSPRMTFQCEPAHDAKQLACHIGFLQPIGGWEEARVGLIELVTDLSDGQ
jgi:hypothetical protein